MSSRAWLVAAVSFAKIIFLSFGDGDASCPCLSQTQPGQLNQLVVHDFGIGCHMHELNVTSLGVTVPPNLLACSNRSTNPAWCTDNWCIIDPNNCSLPNSYMPDIEEYYSYATCGFLDVRSRLMMAGSLKGLPLTIVVISNSGGFFGSYCSGNKCSGPTYDFWQAILDEAGVVKHIQGTYPATWPNLSVPIPFPEGVQSLFARELGQYPLDWTRNSIGDACALAAGLGYVDICIGALIMSSQRVRVSNMIEYYLSDIYMISLSEKEVQLGFLARVLLSFSPFELNLWIAIAVAVAVISLVHAWHEKHVTPSHYAQWTICGIVAGVAQHIYLGWMSFWSGGGTDFESKTRGGKLVNMGMGIFFLMTTAAYTANLATSLIVNAQAGPAVTWAGVQSQGLRVCMDGPIRSYVVEEGRIQPNQVVNKNRQVVLDGILNGECDVVAVRLEDWLICQSRPDQRYCNLVIDSLPLFSIPQGVPVSEKAFRTLLLQQRILVQKGLWQNTSQTAASAYSNACPTTTLTANQLTLANAVGPFFVAGILCAISFVLQFIEAARERILRCRCAGSAPHLAPLGPPLGSPVEPFGQQSQDETVLEQIEQHLHDLCSKVQGLRKSRSPPDLRHTLV